MATNKNTMNKTKLGGQFTFPKTSSTGKRISYLIERDRQ